MENSNNTNNDTNHETNEASNDTSNHANRDINKENDSKKFSWDKIREFFEEFELSNQNMQYPMTIITVSCVVIAICVIFMTFTQLKLLKTFQKLYVVSRYGF